MEENNPKIDEKSPLLFKSTPSVSIETFGEVSPSKVKEPIKELKEMTYEDIIEAELSSDDDEVLKRIEPGNKKSYNLSTNVARKLELGYFKRGYIPTGDQIHDHCHHTEPAFLGRENTWEEDEAVGYLQK